MSIFRLGLKPHPPQVTTMLFPLLVSAMCLPWMTSADHIIQTTSGPIIGTTTRSISNQYVSVYYGIPYAQPPTGNLRFLPPRPINPWNTTFQATTPPPPPHQQIPDDLQSVFTRLNISIPGPWSENCLTLHVWVPRPTPTHAAIVVFIHGGAFITETALWYIDGSGMAADEGIIVVSVEYRLGLFGFLNLGHPAAPGNVGLMDQELALRWVKDNAEAFGGDPDQITLFGTSAGSASVGYHLMSESGRDLFRRGIMMSGVLNNVWASSTPEQSLKKARSLAEALGCWSKAADTTADCLRTKTPEELLKAARTPHFLASRQFGPTALAQSEPDKHVHLQDVLISSTSDEGVEFMMLLEPEYANPAAPARDRFEKLIDQLHVDVPPSEVQALLAIYTDWRNPDDPLTLREAARRIFNDVLFVCHINEFADKLSLNPERRIYRYVYNHRVTPYWFPSADWVRSVHGADQLAVLGPPTPDLPESLEDQRMRVKMTKHFANFAKTGDPNLGEEDFPDEPDWPRYNISARMYNLMEKLSTIRQHHRVQECGTWLHLRAGMDRKSSFQ